MKKISSLILIVVLFSACSINKIYNKKQNFIRKIKRWNNFELSGVVRINYKSLTFSKNIKIKKEPQSAYVDIFESGVFGVNPQILFHAKIDSLVHIKSSLPIKVGLNTNIEKINKALKTIEDNSDVITQTRKFIKNNLTVKFNPIFEISKISYDDMVAIFNYQNELSSIHILKNNKKIASIEVDKIKFLGETND